MDTTTTNSNNFLSSLVSRLPFGDEEDMDYGVAAADEARERGCTRGIFMLRSSSASHCTSVGSSQRDPIYSSSKRTRAISDALMSVRFPDDRFFFFFSEPDLPLALVYAAEAEAGAAALLAIVDVVLPVDAAAEAATYAA